MGLKTIVIGTSLFAACMATSQTKEHTMNGHATGPFDVKLNPLELHDTTGTEDLGRMSLDKKYSGDLQGTSKGEMLSAGTEIKGSAVYVALERVRGTLNGKNGSFILYHTGTMDRGAQHLAISVVPDSGTDEFKGLSGTMMIKIVDGKHYYDFEYSIPESH
jgi:hypothetical protein